MSLTLLFQGKTAIITGSGGGLGKLYALELSKRGANVVINDIITSSTNSNIPNPAEELVKYINFNGGKAIGSYHDVLNGKNIVDDAIKAFGQVDIVINNAGILRDKSFHKLPKEDWYKVINIHLHGTFELCHSVWPHMQERNFGRIVNVGSAAGLYGNFGQSNYSSAKMGIVGLTNTLAIEGAKNNIHVNCIVPVAASKMTETVLPPNILEQLKPEHISPFVTYLCHDSCKETGQIYELGAGWYSTIRLERSYGINLGSKNSFATAENIQEKMREIQNFEHSTHPKTISESLAAILEAKDRPFSVSLKPEPLSNNHSHVNVDKNDQTFQTDRIFGKLQELISSNNQQIDSVQKSIQAKIWFSITSSSSSSSSSITKDWLLDFTSVQPSLTLIDAVKIDSKNPNTKPDVKLYCSDDTFISLVKGQVSPEMAFMKGILKIKGPVTVASKIRSLLELAKRIS